MTIEECKNFKFTNNDFLILTESRFFKKDGDKWVSEIEREVITPDIYTGCVNTVPLCYEEMNYSCKVKESYTPAGRLPTCILLTTEDIKDLNNFVLLSKREMKKSAGYKEKEILTHAERWELLPEDNSQMLYLYATIDGEEKSAIYDINRKEWRG